MTRDEDAMDAWSKLRHQKKPSAYTAKYIDDIYNSVNKVRKIYDPVRVIYNKKNKMYYPGSGGSRIAAAYVAGLENIPVKIVSIDDDKDHLWKKSFGVGTKHFNGMADSIINMLINRRFVDETFKALVASKEIVQNDCAYQIKKMGLRGKYDPFRVSANTEMMNVIKDSSVYVPGSDNGLLSMELSNHCKQVYGRCNAGFKKIADRLKSYLYANNQVSFGTNEADKYDFMFVNSYCYKDKIVGDCVYTWENYSIYRKLT